MTNAVLTECLSRFDIYQSNKACIEKQLSNAQTGVQFCVNAPGKAPLRSMTILVW